MSSYAKDREILRRLAAKQLEYAASPRNAEIMKQWEALAQGRREAPTVRLLFSNFINEVISPRMECEGEEAREIEYTLLSTLVGRELFDDDTPISPTFDLTWDSWASPFGIKNKVTHAKDSIGFHIDPVVEDLGSEIDKLRGGSFGIDREKTLRRRAFADEMIGDILPTRMVMPSLTGAITNPLVGLMGMENYYFAMYDYPDELHEVMDMATRVYEEYYDFLEREGLLLPTCGISPIAQESFAFNSELPTDQVEKTTQCWGFLESQETTAVSVETYGEFVYPYLDRLVKRYGLLSYGCCERVDALWEGYLSKWKNLRKLSVSPFNNEPQIGEYLRGSNVVYYSKPRAEFVTNPGPMDEEALRAYFKMVCESASGCLFEMAQREVGTIFGDFERGRRYVQIARECISEYWKP
ncbi:MAG: hypothetical protein E7428_00660 [Ruminococcaceae bacterium]|nr:hypothetical protein [Oscillospiraceae bacterium]